MYFSNVDPMWLKNFWNSSIRERKPGKKSKQQGKK